MNDKKVYIIGAGMAGLVAAYELEAVGYRPVILEASDSVGGRIRTDLKDGYLLDRGFQIFLTGYPEAKRYLNYAELNLKYFDPDMIILRTDGSLHVTDPFLNPAGIFSMALSKVGNTKDKIKLFTLAAGLLKKPEEEIFKSNALTTREYFLARGFSPEITTNFLNPLFRGIYLENDLKTPSSMFEFVFKMMHKGKVAIPEVGMQEIPNHLYGKLKNTAVRFDTKVKEVDGNIIRLDDGEEVIADEIICTTLPTYLKDFKKEGAFSFHKVTNIYFAISRSFLAQPAIGLVPGENFLINNLVFLTDVSPAYSTTGKALLSVSIVNDTDGIDNLEERVAKELQVLSGIKSEYFEHIHTYEIKEALADIPELKHDILAVDCRLGENVHLAGDYLLNPSLNAAMRSGRRAAESVILKHNMEQDGGLKPVVVETEIG
ncbi:FAD-dependent oxidoreductase [Litoribacter ruber]|uniref:FAD-dependent oxidoreductase n=1 Tax=Litoribacter ruber TaxID=702568 RepID=A0AAP2CI55_9BACT|nr:MULTISPECIES: NAD(P)/FAD-dependent oxidoreductase [Litoribacter]MBS9524612.1 FAD-dependent oxidoreductase [Litoribacter alkaliphilus]MBT0810230.1 FAD-dependent oxidoreductase [Litoribacter ruber]